MTTTESQTPTVPVKIKTHLKAGIQVKPRQDNADPDAPQSFSFDNE